MYHRTGYLACVFIAPEWRLVTYHINPGGLSSPKNSFLNSGTAIIVSWLFNECCLHLKLDNACRIIVGSETKDVTLHWRSCLIIVFSCMKRCAEGLETDTMFRILHNYCKRVVTCIKLTVHDHDADDFLLLSFQNVPLWLCQWKLVLKAMKHWCSSYCFLTVVTDVTTSSFINQDCPVHCCVQPLPRSETC